MSKHHQTDSAYAGRWVAKIRGRIIAQGGTPEQTLYAAQKSRHKEKVEIIYMPLALPLPPLVQKVGEILSDQELYLVGGTIRDLLTDRISRDFDFAVPSNGISTARKVANSLSANFMILDEERDTGRVIHVDTNNNRIYMDFAVYRGENLEADLRNRDFTINAIAYDIRSQTLLDPLDGATDLKNKLIRACSSTSIHDDPVRIFRAIRLAAGLDFKIETETREKLKKSIPFLPNISVERKRDELFKILDGPKPNSSIRALELLGVFPGFLPELSRMKGVKQSPPHVFDVWEHTLQVMEHLETFVAAIISNENISENVFDQMLLESLGKHRSAYIEHFSNSHNKDRTARSLLFFSALYHDVAKPATQSVEETGRIRFLEHEIQGQEILFQRGQELRLSNDEIEHAKIIVRHHMRFHSFTYELTTHKRPPTRRAIYRFFRGAKHTALDLILLALADVRGTRENTLTKEQWKDCLEIAGILLDNYLEKPEQIVSPPRLLDGTELIRELNIEPGPIVGQLLEAIRESQAAGDISSREEALAFARVEISRQPK